MRALPKTLTESLLPFVAARIRWLERWSRPRGAWLLEREWFIRVLGLFVIFFAAGAFLAPPFSGLDTLPAVGAVVFALGIVLSDLVFVGVGVAIGAVGVGLMITVGATVIALFPLAAHGGPLWEPMCYAQIGGLSIATFVTLLLVPVIYAIFVLDLKLVRWEGPAEEGKEQAPGGFEQPGGEMIGAMAARADG